MEQPFLLLHYSLSDTILFIVRIIFVPYKLSMQILNNPLANLINLTKFLMYYFVALHTGGAYKHLMNEEDAKNLKWLKVFK